MTFEIKLIDICEHTLSNILKQGPNTEIGIIIRLWVIFHQFVDFITFLQSSFVDFTPLGTFNTYKESTDAKIELKVPSTPLKQIYNLRRYTQYVINQSDYDVDDQLNHPLLENNGSNKHTKVL